MFKVIVCLAAFAAIGVSGQGSTCHPCNGQSSGFARDLQSCAHFWRCAVNPPTRGECPNGNQFDIIGQRCVLPRNSNCFTCPQERPYELRSVPGVCHQYTRCFNGRVSLHCCPNGLWFDGRNGIRNCNRRPANGVCHPEPGDTNGNVGNCPNVQMSRPMYFRPHDSCSRFVCLILNFVAYN